MLEIRPVSNFFVNFVELGLVSLNGGQRCTESGRKPEREGSSGQPMRLAISSGRAAQDLGVELVGAALDLAGDLVEVRG